MKQRPNKLFEPAQLKALSLQNRIVMAPMTRARTTQPGNIPNEMMATYYQQRASAGLINRFAPNSLASCSFSS